MRRGEALGIAGLGAWVVFCCAALPILVALLGGVAVTALIGGGLLMALLLGVGAGLAVRSRRRACSPPSSDRGAPE